MPVEFLRSPDGKISGGGSAQPDDPHRFFTHSVIDLSGNGLTIRTPRGRELTYPTSDLAKKLLQTSEAISLGEYTDDARELGDSFMDFASAEKVFRAGIQLAKQIVPDFDRKAPDEKIKVIDSVIRAASSGFVVVVEHQTRVAQERTIQALYRGMAKMLEEADIIIPLFTPAQRTELMKALRVSLDIANVVLASKIDPDSVRIGADNLVTIQKAKAEADQAAARARLETERLADSVVDDRKKAAIERKDIAVTNEIGRKAKDLRNFTEIVHQEIISPVANWFKETSLEAADGIKELIFDPEKGLVIRLFDSVGRSWNIIAENVSTPMVAGFGVGGSAGVTSGFYIGVSTLSAIEKMAAIPTSVESAVVWTPAVLLGLGLAAGGGILDTKLMSG